MIVDIRSLNVISQFDSYSLSLQSDIIQAVQKCRFISVIDCVSFFYQWRVHSNDRHKFTVVIHREQKTFNVAIMRYRNSSVYVQKQINRILRSFNFARAYVNDIVIFSETLDDHLLHLRKIFEVLIKNNIFINSKKTFLRYSSVSLLSQHVISLRLFTNKKKLKIIVNLRFSKILRQLKTYLDLTNWFRQYIEHYAIKSKFLQDKKTIFLKSIFKTEKERRFYTSKIKINSTNFELKSFNIIQETLSKSIYLVHFNAKLQLYANLDSSKKIDVRAMIYHVDWNEDTKSYPPKKSVRSIMFLSRQLNSSKQRYWLIELKFAELIWVLRKIRHFIEFIELSIIVFIDHDAALEIIKQTFLSISSTDKLNLRLIRVFDYIQRFNLLIKHKPEKLRLISDALFRLPSNNASNSDHDELNVLFIAILIEMTFEFRNRILNEYIENSVWKKVLKTLDSSEKDNIDLLFLRDNDLIYRKKISHNMPFTSRRLCISTFVVKNILSLVHDENHSEFDRTYLQIVSSWYIQRLTKHIKAYIKHCLKCNLNQTRRHKSYESLQSILTSSVSFHSIAIDFILALFISSVDMNAIMSVTCKFSKRVTAISEKFIWTVSEWADALLQKLDIADWNLLKNIIFDRDKKFLSNLWKNLFNRLKIKLLYITTYHSQTNDVFEKINQTLKIALKFHIQALKNFFKWSNTLDALQRNLNNSSNSTEKTFNEICYEFTSLRSADLIRNDTFNSSLFKAQAKIHVNDSVTLTQLLSKNIYDRNHHLLQMNVENWTLLRLHKNYDIFSTSVLKSKLFQQYAEFFRIIEKVDNLAYKLDISINWRVHSVFFIAHLKPASTSKDDSFKRTLSQSKSIYVEDDTNDVQSFEIERIIISRKIRRRNIEYLVRWKNYDAKHDVWRNEFELKNVKNLLEDFKQSSATCRRNRSSKNKWYRRNVDSFFCLDSCYRNIQKTFTSIYHASFYKASITDIYHASFHASTRHLPTKHLSLAWERLYHTT